MPVLQPIDRYVEGYRVGYKEGFEHGDIGLSELLGTTQPTVEGGIKNINRTLANALTGKGIEAEATETTEELVRKVDGIHDWVLDQVISIQFNNIGLYDDTAIRHFPNLYLPKVRTLNHAFASNERVETIGDIYAPNMDPTVQNADCLGYAFSDSTVRTIGVLTIADGSQFNRSFMGCRYLENIDGINGKLGTLYRTFELSGKLKRIGGKLDLSILTSILQPFAHCESLEEIGFVEGSIHVSISFGSSPKLNDASRQSIKNGLADLTGQTQQTITFHSTVLVKYTEDEILEMMSKNWAVQ